VIKRLRGDTSTGALAEPGDLMAEPGDPVAEPGD
jgi:hypothetical protein